MKSVSPIKNRSYPFFTSFPIYFSIILLDSLDIKTVSVYVTTILLRYFVTIAVIIIIKKMITYYHIILHYTNI